MLENLALRQQLAVLKRKHPRASLRPLDKLFWVVARRFWSRWKEMLVLVQHQQPTLEALQSFLKEIAVASPKTKVIVPKYFQPIPLEK